MATPVKPFCPALPHLEAIGAVSVGSVGVKLSYLVPAGFNTKVLGATYNLNSGAVATIALQVIAEEGTISFQTFIAAGQFSVQFWADAGDTIQWNVTVIGVAGIADLTISCEDYEVQ